MPDAALPAKAVHWAPTTRRYTLQMYRRWEVFQASGPDRPLDEQIRHFFATLTPSMEHGAYIALRARYRKAQEVKEILGHSDLRMTLRYAHLSPAHLRAAVNRLEGLGRPTVAAPMAHGLAHSPRDEAATPANSASRQA